MTWRVWSVELDWGIVQPGELSSDFIHTVSSIRDKISWWKHDFSLWFSFHVWNLPNRLFQWKHDWDSFTLSFINSINSKAVYWLLNSRLVSIDLNILFIYVTEHHNHMVCSTNTTYNNNNKMTAHSSKIQQQLLKQKDFL